ncbi:hypothetical protein [Bradyrhizobium sp. SZCCHNR31012]|uniref:hypothetical protein n=1 Tax=Bradyrhizobium sp. SZCCHNR31012 TaxID=3057454 RepID=UPI0029166C1C|nr:hypothetical protein [Bradyrhizobium sp. SZCCHNR31012]
MSASADLVCVPPQRAREVWPHVAARLRAAYLRTDLGHTADLERDVLEGDGLLWLPPMARPAPPPQQMARPAPPPQAARPGPPPQQKKCPPNVQHC